MNLNPEQGKKCEQLACEFLQARGLTLMERNYRCRLGELDLIMRDGSCVVFVEVRFRRNHRYGTPAETVNRAKQKRLIRAASLYLQSRRIDAACRFDVIAVMGAEPDTTLRWIKNAFQEF
jgi:putative endonuclease